MIRLWLAAGVTVVLATLAPDFAKAHEVRPAYLEITQDTEKHFAITWKQPVVGNLAIRLAPHISTGWLDGQPSDTFATTSFLIKTWSVTSHDSNPLAGQSLSVDGLDQTQLDVLVIVRLLGRSKLEAIIKPDHPSLDLTSNTTGLPIPAYLMLGVEHILTGTDHLMFVLGLLLLVGISRRLVKAITAFTVAHSITLAFSALGLVHMPSTVIEALVALSIVFVAAQLSRAVRGRGGLTQRYPWAIAFTFGLLHGFAFAGALAEVGLPEDAIPISLFLFNVGVEIGQLLFVGAATVVILGFSALRRRFDQGWALIQQAPSYAIGGFAAYWFIERTMLVFS